MISEDPFRPKRHYLKRPWDAVGPFPRSIWTNPSVPVDDYDRICREIWENAKKCKAALLDFGQMHTKCKTQSTGKFVGDPFVQPESFNNVKRSVDPEASLDERAKPRCSKVQDEMSRMVQKEFCTLIAQEEEEEDLYSSVSVNTLLPHCDQDDPNPSVGSPVMMMEVDEQGEDEEEEVSQVNGDKAREKHRRKIEMYLKSILRMGPGPGPPPTQHRCQPGPARAAPPECQPYGAGHRSLPCPPSAPAHASNLALPSSPAPPSSPPTPAPPPSPPHRAAPAPTHAPPPMSLSRPASTEPFPLIVLQDDFFPLLELLCDTRPLPILNPASEEDFPPLPGTASRLDGPPQPISASAWGDRQYPGPCLPIIPTPLTSIQEVSSLTMPQDEVPALPSCLGPLPHPLAPQPEAYDLLADFPALQPQGEAPRSGCILPKAPRLPSLAVAAPEVSYSALFKAVEGERLVGVEENRVTPCPGGHRGGRRKQGSRVGDQKGGGVARGSTLTNGCAKSRRANVEDKRGKAMLTTAGADGTSANLCPACFGTARQGMKKAVAPHNKAKPYTPQEVASGAALPTAATAAPAPATATLRQAPSTPAKVVQEAMRSAPRQAPTTGHSPRVKRWGNPWQTCEALPQPSCHRPLTLSSQCHVPSSQQSGSPGLAPCLPALKIDPVASCAAHPP